MRDIAELSVILLYLWFVMQWGWHQALLLSQAQISIKNGKPLKFIFLLIFDSFAFYWEKSEVQNKIAVCVNMYAFGVKCLSNNHYANLNSEPDLKRLLYNQRINKIKHQRNWYNYWWHSTLKIQATMLKKKKKE